MSQDLEDDAFHDKTSREDVAYHEAGHAVAHWRHDYDRPVDKVTVKPGEGYLGRVESTLPPQVMAAIDRGEEWTAEVDGLIGREVIATLAGPAAEARHRGRENPAGAGSDHRTVMGFAYRCGMEGDLAAAFFEYRNLRARQLVEVNWKLIEAVAAALLERETLSGDECWAVIREARGYSPPPPGFVAPTSSKEKLQCPACDRLFPSPEVYKTSCPSCEEGFEITLGEVGKCDCPRCEESLNLALKLEVSGVASGSDTEGSGDGTDSASPESS